MNFEDYLKEHYTLKTAKIYGFDIQSFISYLTPEKAVNASYKDIMEYIAHLRKKYSNPRTVNRILSSLKAYYQYLVESGQKEDHPCKYINLKDSKNKEIQLQDLFTTEELEMLLERKERYKALQIKNQVAISLLIYQGLTLSELVRITTDDVDLKDATINVKGGNKTTSRVLPLKPKQVMLFYKYLNEERPKLCNMGSTRLLVTLRGTPDTEDNINYLIETLKPLFPGRNLNATSIRQSVITNLLKEGKDLRVVQVFAGHKKASTTEKYKQTAVEELKTAILKYHPLG